MTWEEPVTPMPRPAWVSDAIIRGIETQLLKWPGISRADVARERPRIEQLLDVVAQSVSCGNPPRKAVRDDLAALERHLRLAVALLRKGTLTPLMPAILGRLAWKEWPVLEALARVFPETTDRFCWEPSYTAATLATMADDLAHVADNAAHQISCIPPGGGRNSFMDVRGAARPDVTCAVVAIEAIYWLCRTRPKRSVRILEMICQAIWEVAGGKDPRTPDWKSIVTRILRENLRRGTELAVVKARFALLLS
jgi:hypothetical protein